MNDGPYFFRRRLASGYLKETWGLDVAPRTLAKIACLSSDGPVMHYVGRIPYYSKESLDDFARKKIGPAQRSTSERSEKTPALPSEPQPFRPIRRRRPRRSFIGGGAS
jgi:hypothetical protein